MRRTTRILILLSILAGVGSGVAADAGTFVHTATAANTVGFFTYLDNPRLDDPNVYPLVTQNWNPGGVGGTYNDHQVGVAFDFGGEDVWVIANLDESPMPLGASFNVHVVAPGPNFYVHTALASNTTSSYTTLSHPLLDAFPAAMAQVTQAYGGNNDIHPLLLAYGEDVWIPRGWNIFNSDLATMPHGTSGPFAIPAPVFFVFIPSSSPSAFRHDANPANIDFNWTTIDSPLLNGHPEALVLVTAAEPEAATAVTNPHELGVWYTGFNWAIFNEDQAPMTDGASFNVLVALPIFSDGFESGDRTAWSSFSP